MKNIIRKILKEEFDSDSDWDWVRGIPPAIDKGYFNGEEPNLISLSMAKKIMEDFNVTLEESVDVMWYNFPYDAENVFIWEILNPRTFVYEGVEYVTDVDPISGTVGIQPLGRGDIFYFYVTPNYDGEYGITPINCIIDDDYLNHTLYVTHPNFDDVEEMKHYYRNQHIDDVMGTILDYMDENYNYSNVV